MMPALFRKHYQFIIISVLFVPLSLWWFCSFFLHADFSYGFLSYTNVYFIVALFGGIFGLLSSHKWGSIRSHLGRSITFFSLGLLAQVFGQLSYNYLLIVKGGEIPYPSIGDLGYFGSIPLYILGALSLLKVFSLRSYSISKAKKLVAVAVPLALLTLCYFVFLNSRTISLDDPLRSFLDLGYPFFQAIYLSLAIVAYFLSMGVLGGVLKKCVLLLLFALVVQFVADFAFLYRADRGLVYPGGPTDYMYLVAYFIMSVAIIDFGLVFERLKSGKITNGGTVN